MAYTDWMIKTRQVGTCSCDYGCPCEFSALPVRTTCEGTMALEITEGHYGDVKMASATFWTKGEPEQNYEGRYAAISFVTYGPYGIIDENSHPAVSA